MAITIEQHPWHNRLQKTPSAEGGGATMDQPMESIQWLNRPPRKTASATLIGRKKQRVTYHLISNEFNLDPRRPAWAANATISRACCSMMHMETSATHVCFCIVKSEELLLIGPSAHVLVSTHDGPSAFLKSWQLDHQTDECVDVHGGCKDAQ